MTPTRSIRPQPLLAVKDVAASSRWYQYLLGCQSVHGGEEYDRLVSEGMLVLQLHRFEVAHHHLPIGDPAAKPYGNGVLVWFEVDDFDRAVARARELEAEIVLPMEQPTAPGSLSARWNRPAQSGARPSRSPRNRVRHLP